MGNKPELLDMELLTPEEVATFLKVSRRTIYRWIRSGELKGVALGGKKKSQRRVTLRIPKSALEKFVQDGSEE
jgi:excisionase family DNA binding protein